MIANSHQHNLAVIRSLIKDAFTARDLWRFCQERPQFRDVLADFGFNPALSEMIDVLLEYCRTRALFDELLAETRVFNPRQYERYQAQLHGGDTALPAPQIPHNLPPRSEFVGREAEKARIHEALRSRYFLISIDGIGGIGKTALALEVACECLHASRSDNSPEGIVTFDGFVWATAKDRDLTLNALLDAVALTLDYPGIVQRPLDQKRIGVEKLLREKPCLLIVDNFETVTDDEVKGFLRYLPEPSKALITSREQNLSHVWTISLKGLEQSEALALIRGEGRRLGLPSIEEAEDRMLLYLHEATGGAPLALKWAVGQIKQRGQSLDAMLTALHEARGDVFEDIFARSWRLLSTDARRVLMVMPLFATSVSRAAIEAVSDVHHFALDEALGQLVEMSLMDSLDELELARRRFSVHPLSRAFAKVRLGGMPEFLAQAQQRAVEYFLGFSQRYGGSRRHWRTFDRIDQELENIVQMSNLCYEKAREEEFYGAQLIEFGWALRNAFWTRCHWQTGIELFEKVIEVSRQIGDIKSVGWRSYDVGWLHSRFNVPRARDCAQKSLRAFKAIENMRGIGFAKHLLGCMARDSAEYDEALAHLDEAMQILEDHGKGPSDIAVVKLGLGILHYRQGDLHSAECRLREALDSQDEAYENRVMSVLGLIYLDSHDLAKAEQYFNTGLAGACQVGREDIVAYCEYGMARIMKERGNLEQALTLARKAADSLERLGLERDCHDAQSLVDEIASGLQQTRLARVGDKCDDEEGTA